MYVTKKKWKVRDLGLLGRKGALAISVCLSRSREKRHLCFYRVINPKTDSNGGKLERGKTDFLKKSSFSVQEGMVLRAAGAHSHKIVFAALHRLAVKYRGYWGFSPW